MQIRRIPLSRLSEAPSCLPCCFVPLWPISHRDRTPWGPSLHLGHVWVTSVIRWNCFWKGQRQDAHREVVSPGEPLPARECHPVVTPVWSLSPYTKLGAPGEIHSRTPPGDPHRSGVGSLLRREQLLSLRRVARVSAPLPHTRSGERCSFVPYPYFTYFYYSLLELP